MAQTETALLTVAEYEKIPNPSGGHYELHHGECVLVPPPMKQHADVSRRLNLALTRICPGWMVDKELAFRPLPEYEVWAADVGMVSIERWDATGNRAWLTGAPELVVEALSPSNTAQEIDDKQATCFQGGCQEFWVVNPNLRTVRVATPDGQSWTYGMKDDVPLDRFAAAKLAVSEAFAE